MNADEPVRIALGEAATIAELQQRLRREQPEIREAFEWFERIDRPFDVTLEWSGLDGSTENLQASTCETLSTLLVDLEPDLPRLQSIGARWIHGPRLHHATLVVSHELESDPIGILLLERSLTSETGVPVQADSVPDIRETLERHVMARPDSEYAIGIEVSATLIRSSRETLIQGLELAPAIIDALPAATPNEPNVRQMHVRLREGDGTIRLRIWRLGYMRVRPGTRVV